MLHYCPACQRSFDIFRSSVVAFDEVAVVAVHRAHEVGQWTDNSGRQAAATAGEAVSLPGLLERGRLLSGLPNERKPVLGELRLARAGFFRGQDAGTARRGT